MTNKTWKKIQRKKKRPRRKKSMPKSRDARQANKRHEKNLIHSKMAALEFSK